MEGALTNMVSREIRALQPSLVWLQFRLWSILKMDVVINISQPVITFDMLISYLKHGEYVKLQPNSSEDFLNVSTIEFSDPYNVEPDLSAGVGHRCSQDVALTWGVSGVHPLLPLPHSGRGPRLHHEFHRVLALLEKQKGWKKNSWDNIVYC